MRIEYDPAADALYIAMKPGAKIADTVTTAPGVNVDVDGKRRLVGIEILYVVHRFGRSAMTTLGVDLSGLGWSPIQDRLIATAEASRLLGVSRQYVTKLAREGKLPATRAGRDWLIHKSGLDRVRRRDRSEGGLQRMAR
jgi:excisionase family DNA binding protein